MKRMIRVMLIEDHPEYREVLAVALEKAPDMNLTGQFGAAERALRGLQDHHKQHDPDIILIGETR